MVGLRVNHPALEAAGNPISKMNQEAVSGVLDVGEGVVVAVGSSSVAVVGLFGYCLRTIFHNRIGHFLDAYVQRNGFFSLKVNRE